jgi:uncharacterized membrane protein (DUF373 family)
MQIIEKGSKNLEHEPVIIYLTKIIRFGVRLLAILMTLLILLGIADTVWEIYKRLLEPPRMLLTISDILATFGAFLAVLIAIEIFENITLYLRDDVIHVRIVVATALMAIARKVIVFDFNTLQPAYIWATAAVIIALGITFFLLSSKNI